MQIGQRRFRIAIEKLASTPDGFGGSTDAWTPHATLWAGMESQTGQEGETADRLMSQSKARFTVRRNDTILPSMRVTWKGRKYNILSADPVDASDTLLYCELIGDGGSL